MQLKGSKRSITYIVQLFALALAAYVCWLAAADLLGPVQVSAYSFFVRLSERAIGWALFLLLNAAFLVMLGLLIWKKGPLAGGSALARFIASTRDNVGWLRWLTAASFVLLPSLLILYLPSEAYLGEWALRFWILCVAALGFAMAAGSSRSIVDWKPLLMGFLLVSVVFALARGLTKVTDYPFTLSWSEGNRFYDYSLIFGRSLYTSNYPVELAYYSPGRYALWGLPFLIPGLSIAVHRLWDVLLWNVTPILLGVLLFPQLKWKWRLGLGLWVALFLYQGPIYPSLVIPAIVLALSFYARGPWKWLGIALGSLYAGASRWTWAGAVGVWAAVLEGLNHPRRDRSLIPRYIPAFLLFLAGLIPGILVNLPRWLTPKESTLSLSQPLLWYRLLPNPTYETGVLLGLIIAITPLVALVKWLGLTRRWQLDWTQVLMMAAACAAFLAAGLVASTKIGGGSNLHNLDMFFLLLVFIFAAAVRALSAGGEPRIADWPGWIRLLVVACVLIPVWLNFSYGGPAAVVSKTYVQEQIAKIQQAVDAAQLQGEVLFIDQRQLITFGQIKGVNMIADYEKKYMMDQAMAGNAIYFGKFYQDLAKHRFTLIVTEPVNLAVQGDNHNFGEENDAYVQWVSNPLLCYYESALNLEIVNVELLRPRTSPPPAEVKCPAP